eukprot:XP_027314763.1 uncharacterized protein LOC113843839 [Anas platyrhynchos]
MKIRGWGETTAVCNCWGYLPPSGGRSTPLELSSLISEEAAAWCVAVWVQQSLSRSSICQHGYGWSSAAVSPVVGQPPGIPCDGVAPKDPWLVQRLIYFQACVHEDHHNCDSLKNYLHSFTVFQLWSGPWSSEGVRGLSLVQRGGAALQRGAGGGSAAAPGRAGMRDELATSTAKGLIKTTAVTLFSEKTAQAAAQQNTYK